MSHCKFESAVKFIPYSQEQVYARLSDLNNLETVRQRLSDPAVQAALQQQVPADKLDGLQQKMREMRFDTDSVSFNASPVGDVCLRIIEREPCKCVKLEAQGAPMELNLWIQLLPVEAGRCKMRLTIGAELNFFMKGVVSKPLQKGVEQLADMLAALPYGM